MAIATTDTALNVLDHLLARYFINWHAVTHAAYELVGRFWYTGHKTDGMHAIDAVKMINKELPILLVHALDDEFVSIYSSWALYYELLLGGHNPEKLFLLQLTHGKHGKYNVSDEKSAHIFQAGTHAFYSLFHAPHDAKLAEEGEKYLAKSQPSLEKIKAQLGKEALRYFLQSEERRKLREKL